MKTWIIIFLCSLRLNSDKSVETNVMIYFGKYLYYDCYVYVKRSQTASLVQTPAIYAYSQDILPSARASRGYSSRGTLSMRHFSNNWSNL